MLILKKESEFQVLLKREKFTAYADVYSMLIKSRQLKHYKCNYHIITCDEYMKKMVAYSKYKRKNKI